MHTASGGDGAQRHDAAGDRTRSAAHDGGEGDARRRVRIGHLWIDHLTRDTALAALAALVQRGKGGAVFTPNVDHVVTAEHDERLRGAYRRADLALADGVPILWAARLLGAPLPEKLSGSDLIEPIVAYGASLGWRIYLLGGAPGSAVEAARRLEARYGATIVGTDDARISMEPDAETDAAALARIRTARPDLVLVGLGAPKQELWIDRMAAELAPAVGIGLGASIDFVAGRVRRAPAFVSRIGLEWLYRLVQEPRRLWRRYLVRDPRFVLVVWRTWRMPRERRVVNAMSRSLSPSHAASGGAPWGGELEPITGPRAG